jgi:hypothetical protein
MAKPNDMLNTLQQREDEEWSKGEWVRERERERETQGAENEIKGA